MEQKEILEFIIYPFINLIYIYSFVGFFNHYYPNKNKKMQPYFAVAVIAAYFAIELPSLFSKNSLLILAMNLCAMFFLSLFYKSKILSKIFSTVILYVFSLAVESLWLCLYSIATATPIQTILGQTYTVMFLAAVSRLTFFALTKLATPLFRISKQERETELYIKSWVFIILIPSASLTTIYILFRQFSAPEESLTFIVGISLILLINFCVFYLYDCLLKEATVQQENNLLIKQNEMLEQHFRENAKSSELIQNIRHDIKHIMLAVLSEAESAQIPSKEKLQEKFQAILGDISWCAGPSQSGLAGIDVVVNYKANSAKQFAIEFETNIRLPPDYAIDNRAVAIILGNALDNAIEACKELPIEKRIVKIFITQHLNNLFISVSNPYHGKILFGKGELPKTNKTQRGHGIGLKSIQSIVESHGGYFRYDTNNQIFKLETLLFCESSESISKQ